MANMSDNLYIELIRIADILFNKGEKEKSILKLIEAYNIKPQGNIAFRIFTRYINIYDYDNALIWLRILLNNKSFSNDSYTYLILFDYILKLPDDLKQIIDGLTEKDLLLKSSDHRFNDIYQNNQIRKRIFSHDFKGALKGLRLLFKQEKIEPQEYTIYRLLSEIVTKKPNRIKTLIRENKFDELISYLDSTDYKDKDIIFKMLKVKEKLEIGIILDKKDGISSNLEEALKNYDFDACLKYTNDNEILNLLVNKLISLNTENYIFEYQGILVNPFYTYSSRIHDALYRHKKDEAISLIKEYLTLIDKENYIEYLIKMVEVYTKLGGKYADIVDVLADVTYKDVIIDERYLKHLFGKYINKKFYPLCESIIEACDSLNIDSEYLKHLCNYQKYLSDGVKYEGYLIDDTLYKKLDEIRESVVKNNNIEILKANSSYEECVIRNYINSHNDLAYSKRQIDDDTYEFFIKQDINALIFYRDELIFKVKLAIERKDYISAERLLLKGIGLANRFDRLILSLLAHTYKCMGKMEEFNKITYILKEIALIDDYNEILNSDEASIMDLDQEYTYGIKDIELIIDDVVNKLIPYDEVITKYNVSFDDEPYVYGILARECFRKKNFLLGEEIYKEALSIESCDEELKRFLRIVKCLKPYYNRIQRDAFVNHVKKLVNS